jgi:hypothetical protein
MLGFFPLKYFYILQMHRKKLLKTKFSHNVSLWTTENCHGKFIVFIKNT